jgi:hypothetical protein
LVIIHISLLNFPNYAFSDGFIFARFVLRDRYDRDARVVSFREMNRANCGLWVWLVASKDALTAATKVR